jgi:hypothetical protein
MKLPHRRRFLHLAASAAALPALSRVSFLLSRPEHGRIIPLSEVNSSYIARGAPFARLRLR